MKQFFVSIVVVAFALAGQACASGFGGYGSLPVVVASNAALPYQVLAASQAVQPFYGGYGYGYGNVPLCRLQDLQGLPAVSQAVIVRVDKTRGHRTADIVGAAVVGAGLGGLSAGWQGAAYGAAAGGGGGLLVSNHEYDYCLYLPAPKP